MAVLGFIAAPHGLVHYQMKERSLNSADVKLGLQAVREKLGWQVKIAVFWDNATIHRSHETTRYASEVVKIKLVRNIPYRPDLNGIERFWAMCKRQYKKQIGRVLTQGLNWTNQTEVEVVLDNIYPQHASACAHQGF